MSLIKYVKPFWRSLIFVMLLLLLQSLTELLLPTLMSSIVNDGIVYSVQTGEQRTDFILFTGAKMLFFALLAGAFSITVTYISPKIAAGVSRNLRRDIFVKVESFSQAEFDKFSSASLITRCTNDVMQVQNVLNIIPRMLLYAPILAIGGVVMALHRAPSLSWILGLGVVILIGLTMLLVSVVMPKFKQIQEKTDNINRVSREILHGLQVIRAFGTQDHEISRFDETNVNLRDLGLSIAKIMALVNPLMTFMMGFTQVAIIWFGANSIATDGMLIGDMMAFFQYTMQVLFSFMMISMVLVMIPRAQVSAKRINEILNTEVSIKDNETEKFSESKRGLVQFSGVSFSYEGAEACAVKDITFTAAPGQTTALIGATGSGKSTIAQLLLRFYDVSSGKITVSGADIRNVSQKDLREKIGYVPQKAQLLSGTIESNIRYGKNISDDELEKVAEVAQSLNFINEKDGGFNAEISQSGTNVSGGQRQRLSIARALAKKPDIIVFDDSFSALDYQTDAKLRKALKEYTADVTVIVIAQRIGTIINADQILVIEEGQIVGRGTHKELLENCPQYREIAQSQNI